jgi:hypothetical protein
MDAHRFKIVFDKLREEIDADDEVTGSEDSPETESHERDEIEELRRIVLETTVNEPCFFTST